MTLHFRMDVEWMDGQDSQAGLLACFLPYLLTYLLTYGQTGDACILRSMDEAFPVIVFLETSRNGGFVTWGDANACTWILHRFCGMVPLGCVAKPSILIPQVKVLLFLPLHNNRRFISPLHDSLMQKSLELRSGRHPRNTLGSSLEVVRLFEGMGLKGVQQFFVFLDNIFIFQPEIYNFNL